MNSKYTGAQAEALLDSVSGKTIYQAGTNIAITNGVISATGGGGGGDLSNYYTSAQTQEYVQGELADYYTSGETQAYVQEQLSGISGGGVSEERFEGLEEATANALYQHELTLQEYDSRFDNYITAAAVDAKLAYKANTSDVNALTNRADSIETATAAAICDLHDATISGVTGYDQAYTIRVMTQAAYDALATKDANTIYIIQG